MIREGIGMGPLPVISFLGHLCAAIDLLAGFEVVATALAFGSRWAHPSGIIGGGLGAWLRRRSLMSATG